MTAIVARAAYLAARDVLSPGGFALSASPDGTPLDRCAATCQAATTTTGQGG